MKKLTLLTVFVLMLLNSKGQNYTPFPTENTKWMCIQQSPGPIYPFIDYIFSMTNGDTIINNKHYTVIDRLNFPTCFIRENNELVYCKYSSNSPFDTTEFLLYNFNLQLGDTMQLATAGYEFRFDVGYVTSIDSLLVGSSYHKKIKIEGAWKSFDFVEGIGSLQDLFYPEIQWVDWSRELTCFSKNDTIFSLDGTGSTYIGNCWQYVKIAEKLSSKLLISPNPTKDNILVSGQKILKVELYTACGQKIMESTNPNITLNEYSCGIYFLKVFSSDNKIENFKIIKE